MTARRVDRGEPRLPERRARPWEAFAYRDFRLLFTGQIVSRMGTWMQFTSMTYLIGVILAHSEAQAAWNLGVLGACQATPALFMGLVAGYVADRYPRKRTLLIIAVLRSLIALAFAAVSRSNGDWVVPMTFLIAALMQSVDTFDTPTRQGWLTQIVPRSLYGNATGVNSIGNNLPLMVGPAVAGILIGTVGVYISFLVNAVAQCIVLSLVFFMRPPPPLNASREPMVAQIAQGMKYMVTHPALRWIMVMMTVTSLCVRPYTQLLAAFAGQVLHVDAKAYGLMLGIGGVGTVGGALVTALWRWERRGLLWGVSGVLAALGLVILAFVQKFAVVIVILGLISLAWMTFNSALFVITQLQSPDEMRGRMVSLFSTIYFAVIPAGALLMGAAASFIGLPLSYAIGGALGATCVAAVWIAKPAARRT